ncbi:MAG: hypothetical protein DGJ47_000745 [Rickettsiaceae bacterium]
MQKKISQILLLVTALIYLCSCQNSAFNKQQSGTLIGGVAGGLLGAQFGGGTGQIAAAGIGALAGSMIGANVGQTLDNHDREIMRQSSQKALETSPTGSSVKWNNPDSGNYGYITPTKTIANDGNICREYQQKVIIDGKTQNAYGTACRQSDGSWKIVK